MKTTVARIYRFRATHSLPDFESPWCHPHQHDYTVELVAEGGTSTDELDRLWAWGAFNDQDLNESFEPSTVENIASVLLNASPLLLSVTVWEDKQRWGRAER